MPGVPSGKGCDACRKLKKRCDQTKPICKRCKRLGLECINNGVKRWKFMPQAADMTTVSSGTIMVVPAPRPRRNPSNDTTLTSASLIHILNVEDSKYDVLQSGGQFFLDLPSRLGHNPMLDSSVKALVASYYYVHHHNLDGETLASYGNALEQIRIGMQDPSISVAVKMYSVILISFCQDWIDHRNREWALHRQTVAYMLQDALANGTLSEVNPKYIQPICQLVAWESWLNPNVTLGDWFWQVLSHCSVQRPHTYNRGQTFFSLQVETQAEISVWLRDPEAHLYQLQCAYKLTLEEIPMIRVIADYFAAAAELPDATEHIKRSRQAFMVGRAMIILIAARINRILQLYTEDPSLVKDIHDMVDDLIEMALASYAVRPLGAGFAPRVMKVVLAATFDDYRRNEIEEMMRELQKDFPGADYMVDADYIRSRFELMESGACQYL